MFKTRLAGLALLVSTVVSGSALAESARSGSTPPPWMTERRIIGTNMLEKIQKAKGSDAYDFARPVARVEDETGDGFCTGWRVAEDMFMTNFHCYEYMECDKIQFHLNYQDDVRTADQPVFKCVKVINANVKFDYALYEVKLVEDRNGYTPEDDVQVISLWNGPITIGQKLTVVGHPAARSKELDRSVDCKMRTIVPEEMDERQTITHMCDTEGGSSGSPVMDAETGYAVALHWGGTYEFNLAIPMSLIIKDLEATIKPDIMKKLRIAQ